MTMNILPNLHALPEISIVLVSILLPYNMIVVLVYLLQIQLHVKKY